MPSPPRRLGPCRLNHGAWVGAAAAVTAPAVGTGLYLLYTRLSLDTWLGPFSTQRDYRGDLVDPVSRRIGDAILAERGAGRIPTMQRVLGRLEDVDLVQDDQQLLAFELGVLACGDDGADYTGQYHAST